MNTHGSVSFLPRVATVSTVVQFETDSAAALHRLVDELRRERFRRYWCAQRLQRAVLEFLYVASDGGVPRISRSYLREAAFVVPPTVR